MRILAYVLYVLGLLTITFFRHYGGSIIPYPWLYWVVGFLFFVGGWLLLQYAPSANGRSDVKKMKRTIDDLKENGEKIVVDLSACELKSNDYSEEQSAYPDGNLFANNYRNDIIEIDALTGNEMENVKMVDIFQSVLIFKRDYLGQTETFISGIISTEHTTLLFKLDMQKTTYIYVDRQDRRRYYFDLEFLSA